MDLKEAQMLLKKLDNEYEFWLKEKELAQSIVLPKAVDIRGERVDGGTREDKMLKYIEILDNKKIDETLDYIYKKQQNLIEFIEKELKRIGMYNEIERKIYELRNDEEYCSTHRGKKRPMWQIANEVGYCRQQCYRILRKAKKKRNV